MYNFRISKFLKSIDMKSGKKITSIISIAVILGGFFLLAGNFSKSISGLMHLFPKPNLKPVASVVRPASNGPGFAILWMTDFNNNRVVGFTPEGKVVWAQNMSAPPIPRSSWYFVGGVERVTVAPNGNLITSYGDAMIVDEIDRKTHKELWQYGTAGLQTYRGGSLDEPHKAYKIDDHEVVINDSNDRLVKVVDQNTNQVVWQYGEYHVIGNRPGILQGNTSVRPVDGGKEFLITETLAKRIILVDRATKNIVWQFTKPDAKWLENVSIDPTNNNFVLEDRQKGEVFEVNRNGKIVWDLAKLSDENTISYPTDTAVLANGNVLIAESGKDRIVEVVPMTGMIVREYKIHGMVTTIAIDQNNLNGIPLQPGKYAQPSFYVPGKPQIIMVDDAQVGMGSGGAGTADSERKLLGKTTYVNASTGRAGQISLSENGMTYPVEVYNYSRVMNKKGWVMSLDSVQAGDKISVTGNLVQDLSR